MADIMPDHVLQQLKRRQLTELSGSWAGVRGDSGPATRRSAGSTGTHGAAGVARQASGGAMSVAASPSTSPPGLVDGFELAQRGRAVGAAIAARDSAAVRADSGGAATVAADKLPAGGDAAAAGQLAGLLAAKGDAGVQKMAVLVHARAGGSSKASTGRLSFESGRASTLSSGAYNVFGGSAGAMAVGMFAGGGSAGGGAIYEGAGAAAGAYGSTYAAAGGGAPTTGGRAPAATSDASNAVNDTRGAHVATNDADNAGASVVLGGSFAGVCSGPRSSRSTRSVHSIGGYSFGFHSQAPTNQVLAKRWHESVTVLFADIVGFTTFSKEVEPETVMLMLHDLFSRYDAACTELGVYKVETIGDCYMACTGESAGSAALDAVSSGCRPRYLE